MPSKTMSRRTNSGSAAPLVWGLGILTAFILIGMVSRTPGSRASKKTETSK